MDKRKIAQGMGRLLAGLAPRGHYYHYTNDPDARLCYAHYSDPAFNGDGAIIYGAADGVTEWIEGDTLRRLTTQESDALTGEYGSSDTARAREAVLRIKTGRAGLRLICIVARTDSDDGYTRNRYGVIDEPAP